MKTLKNGTQIADRFTELITGDSARALQLITGPRAVVNVRERENDKNGVEPQARRERNSNFTTLSRRIHSVVLGSKLDRKFSWSKAA